MHFFMGLVLLYSMHYMQNTITGQVHIYIKDVRTVCTTSPQGGLSTFGFLEGKTRTARHKKNQTRYENSNRETDNI